MADLGKREEVKRLATEQAWGEHGDCPHCGGSGESPDVARRLVHCMTQGMGLGADWDLDSVLALIDGAEQVSWVDGFMGHDLHVVDSDGKGWLFQVERGASRG